MSEEEEKWVIKPVKGTRILANGEVRQYIYNRKYKKHEQETRGAKLKPNKSRLRAMIKNLSDADCANVIQFITTQENIKFSDKKITNLPTNDKPAPENQENIKVVGKIK